MTESEQRHFEVLLEEISGKVNLVLEGHEALDGKIDRYHQEAKEDYGLAVDLIKGLNHKIDGVEQRLDAKIDGVRDELKGDIQGVRDELRDTREELSSEIQAVGEKVDGHEDRITRLEQKAA